MWGVIKAEFKEVALLVGLALTFSIAGVALAIMLVTAY
jgi:hypothetical protein